MRGLHSLGIVCDDCLSSASPEGAAEFVLLRNVMTERDSITEAILVAALTLFGERGFKATSLSQVALAAGVTRPTVYARYDDKMQLFHAVLQREYNEAIVAIEGAAKGEGSFGEVLQESLFAYYGTLFDRFHSLPKVDELALVQSNEAEHIVVEAREQVRKRLARMIRSQIKRGNVDAKSLPMPVPQLVDLIRQSPASFKTPETTRAQYRRSLANLARLVAQSVSAKD